MMLGKLLLFVQEVYRESPKKRLNDEKLRKIVREVYSPVLNLKTNFERLPVQPSILVCNYCNDRLENLACILIPKDIAIMMKSSVRKLDRLIKWPILIGEKDAYEYSKKEIRRHVDEKRSVFSYVTSYPKDEPTLIRKVRSGMFSIAKELNIPITMVAIDYIDIRCNRINRQNFQIEIGETFFVDDVDLGVRKSKRFFKDCMRKFEKEKYEL